MPDPVQVLLARSQALIDEGRYAEAWEILKAIPVPRGRKL